MSLKSQYETAVTLAAACKDALEALDENSTDAEWLRVSQNYLDANAKVRRLHKAWRHEVSKASFLAHQAVQQ